MVCNAAKALSNCLKFCRNRGAWALCVSQPPISNTATRGPVGEASKRPAAAASVVTACFSSGRLPGDMPRCL